MKQYPDIDRLEKLQILSEEIIEMVLTNALQTERQKREEADKNWKTAYETLQKMYTQEVKALNEKIEILRKR